MNDFLPPRDQVLLVPLTIQQAGKGMERLTDLIFFQVCQQNLFVRGLAQSASCGGQMTGLNLLLPQLLVIFPWHQATYPAQSGEPR